MHEPTPHTSPTSTHEAFPPEVEAIFAGHRLAQGTIEPPISRIRSTVGRKVIATEVAAPDDIMLPTFEAMRPKPNEVATYQDKEGGFDLRIASTRVHEDGIAYNPATETVVVSDGMNGVGEAGPLRSTFAFALAHAVAEMPDILALTDPAVVDSVVTKARETLSGFGIGVVAKESTMRTSFKASANTQVAATLAAVQRDFTKPNSWKYATFGDSPIVALDQDGNILQGFSESFQLISQGRLDNPKNRAPEEPVPEDEKKAVELPLASFIGITKDSESSYVSYNNSGKVGRLPLGAEFGTIDLPPGARLVVASDAYVQKTPIGQLKKDAQLSPEEWKAQFLQEDYSYGDDTTMAIVDTGRLASRAATRQAELMS